MEIKEMIEVLKAFEEGKEIERQTPPGWIRITNLDYTNFNFGRSVYRIKPQPTREDITSAWVKDNNIIVGSKVKVVKKFDTVGCGWVGDMNNAIGKCGIVSIIREISIEIKIDGVYEWDYPIESLEPYKEVCSPFSWADRDLFRDKWIRLKRSENEHRINFIGSDGSVSCENWKEPRELIDLFNEYEFIDGTPFGKLA